MTSDTKTQSKPWIEMRELGEAVETSCWQDRSVSFLKSLLLIILDTMSVVAIIEWENNCVRGAERKSLLQQDRIPVQRIIAASSNTRLFKVRIDRFNSSNYFLFRNSKVTSRHEITSLSLSFFSHILQFFLTPSLPHIFQNIIEIVEVSILENQGDNIYLHTYTYTSFNAFWHWVSTFWCFVR